MARRRVSRGVRAAGVAGAVAGAALFVWSIRAAGADAVVDGVRRLGAGFLAVIALGGVRHLVRSVAWRLCLDEPARCSTGAAFAAYVAGDAIGNITPFGFLISEPSKIVLVRGRVGGEASIAALTIENLFYTATVVCMLVAGTAALLYAFPVPPSIRVASLVTLVSAAAAAVAVAWIVGGRVPVASATAARLAGARHADRLQQVRAIEQRIFGFVGRRPERVVPILLLEAAYHVAAVAEIWIVLAMVTGAAPSLLTAFVLEYVNRTITIAFQFVPMWLGVDEAGTGLVARILGIGAAAGVALALVRKARTIVWTAVGVVLLMRHGIAPRTDFDVERSVRL